MYILGGKGPEKLETEMIDQAAVETYYGAQQLGQRDGRKIWYRSKQMGNKIFWFECGVKCDDPTHSNRPVDGCPHVLSMDPVHPEGIKMLPEGLFLCKTCFYLLERCKFKRHMVHVWCYDCVEAECRRLKEINPELFVDLRIRTI